MFFKWPGLDLDKLNLITFVSFPGSHTESAKVTFTGEKKLHPSLGGAIYHTKLHFLYCHLDFPLKIWELFQMSMRKGSIKILPG